MVRIFVVVNGDGVDPGLVDRNTDIGRAFLCIGPDPTDPAIAIDPSVRIVVVEIHGDQALTLTDLMDGEVNTVIMTFTGRMHVVRLARRDLVLSCNRVCPWEGCKEQPQAT